MIRRNSFSRGCNAPGGFTLVELLVVISIIGMLMALLLPAVQGARETGRANTCRNNLHNLSLATIQYAENAKSYPGWNNFLNASIAPSLITAKSANAAYVEGTFVLPLLPFIEHGDIYSLYGQYMTGLNNGNVPAAMTTALQNAQVYLANLVCPSSPQPTTGTPLAYIINGGQLYLGGKSNALPSVTETSLGATVQVLVAQSSGLAYDQTGYITSSGSIPAVKVTPDFVQANDGTSNTIMLSENVLPGTSWSLLYNNAGSIAVATSYASPATSGSSVSPVTTSTTSAASTGVAQQNLTAFFWASTAGAVSTNPAAPPSGYFTINGDKTNTAVSDQLHARPCSAHPGIANFAFCDGHVQTISESVAYNVYKQLMTPYGGQSYITTGGGGGSTTTTNTFSGSYDLDMINTVPSNF